MDEEARKEFVKEALENGNGPVDVQIALTIAELTTTPAQKVLELLQHNWKFVQQQWRESHGLRG